MNAKPASHAPAPAADEFTILRKELVFNQLLGSYYEGDDPRALRELQDARIPVSGSRHAMLLVEMEAWKGHYSRKEHLSTRDERGEMQFVLSNLGLELFHFDGQCRVAFFTIARFLVFWLDTDADALPVMQAAEQLAQLVESNYRMVLSVVVSRWFDRPAEAADVYRSMQDVLFYNRFLGTDRAVMEQITFANDNGHPDFAHELRIETELYFNLREQNHEGLRRCFLDLYRESFQQERPSLTSYVFRREHFFHLIELTIWELDVLYPDKLQAESRIAALHTLEAGLDWLEEVLEILDTVSGPEPKQDCPEWVGTLQQIIEQEYADQNLTVYSLADRVGIGASYCTRCFRQYTGISLLGCLQQVRAAHARSCLESGMSLRSTAEQTGFGSVRTLQRTLRKTESQCNS